MCACRCVYGRAFPNRKIRAVNSVIPCLKMERKRSFLCLVAMKPSTTREEEIEEKIGEKNPNYRRLFSMLARMLCEFIAGTIIPPAAPSGDPVPNQRYTVKQFLKASLRSRRNYYSAPKSKQTTITIPTRKQNGIFLTTKQPCFACLRNIS